MTLAVPYLNQINEIFNEIKPYTFLEKFLETFTLNLIITTFGLQIYLIVGQLKLKRYRH
jgi:hypothetical protein